MLLDIQRKFFARTERVKSVDFHPTEPWFIAALYSGSVHIYNYESGSLVKTFEVSDVPVRCVRFVARKNWFIAGSDDFFLRCYNYNTHEKIAAFEAHPDYIRSIAVHPTGPYVLTGSDDMSIRMWDWDNNWRLMQTFEGHSHFVMHLAFNPKDSNTFASASLDRTVKVWTLGAPVANFTLEAHEKGVNYVDYYHGSDRPYMVTTGDDRTIRVWDYLSKSAVQTLTGHTSNVSFAIFHPTLPLIISGAEDGTVKLWHANTYRLESTLDYALERVWCISYQHQRNDIVLGFDEGVVAVKLGKEDPCVSMDTSGKVVWARNADVLSANVGAVPEAELEDGARVLAPVRDLGNSEVYAQLLQHSPNGRFIAVCGDGEYTIYTALAWRNKAFGSALDFAWSADSTSYAIRDNSPARVRAFRNFKEVPGLFSVGYTVESIVGGALLGVIGVGFVCFYDWATGALVRRINVEAQQVHWSPAGDRVVITTSDSFYVLAFQRYAYEQTVAAGVPLGDEGFEDAFDVLSEIPETELYVLGYLPQHNRVFAADKDMNIFAFSLSLVVVEYQSAVLQGDLARAAELLPSVPASQRSRVAKFLEAQGMLELALGVAVDADHRFDLAVQLGNFDVALDIARAAPASGAEMRWRTIGDQALARWNMPLAQECFENAGDLSTLLLLSSASRDAALLAKVGDRARARGEHNLAFAAYLQAGDTEACVSVLRDSGRVPEAAMFARTYAPALVPELVDEWQGQVGAGRSAKQQQLAATIANPRTDPGLFEGGAFASTE